MSKFVCEENPQVTLWRQKCEKLEEENKKLKELCEWLREKNAEYFNSKRRCRIIFEERFKEFNRLPWYKKLFFRFEI